VTFKGTLYPFQEIAVQKMVEPGGTLVAYDMGLGKTILSIAAAEKLIEEGQAGGGIVICPASLKYQWQRQIAAFTDGAVSLIVDGTPKQRLKQYMKAKNGEVEYLIINYDQVVNDWGYVKNLPRDFIVLDEGTAIKNFKPARSRAIKLLQAEWRWCLTGQPVENRAEEVFSIMQWVDPTVLGDFDLFDETFIVRNHYGDVQRYKELPRLHKRLRDVMVRRTRADVADQMPSVVEESLLIQFDLPARKLYRHIVADLLAVMDGEGWAGTEFDLAAHYGGWEDDEGNAQKGMVASRYVCLRMLCDHPELLTRSADRYTGTDNDNAQGSSAGSAYAAELQADGLLEGLKETPKLDTTIDLIKEILDASPDNKVVLFSFFKDALQLIQQRVHDKELTYSVRFTGDMNALEKDKAKQTFATNKGCRLFLSSDAGGYGLDLPMANYLISFDLPWSAGAWDQRNARIVRLSTEFPEVTLISMLMDGSVEERQYDALTQKQSIGAAIMDGKGHDAKGDLHLTLGSLSDFLRKSSV
jgi:SNF2 family DNA or RNA helicase